MFLRIRSRYVPKFIYPVRLQIFPLVGINGSPGCNHGSLFSPSKIKEGLYLINILQLFRIIIRTYFKVKTGNQERQEHPKLCFMNIIERLIFQYIKIIFDPV